ncbi:MAG: hypothetical protein HY983_02560 [Candidatus Magasanikbacteria bacterium]|nr:hypothetical protein [Candidatus Magasanikbacteria bacterium]
MSEPTYRQTLAHAWKLVWHHKILWIFGLLSVLLGQFGLDNFVGQMALLGSGRALFLPRVQGFSLAPFFKGAAAWWSVWLLVIVIGVLALSILMTVAAQGALIAAAGNWFKIKRSPKISKAWHTGVAHFWRLLLVNIIKRILFLILLLALYRAAISLVAFESAAYQAMLIFIFSVGTFCALIISATTIYASGYIVIEREDALTAFRHGWGLLHRHFLASLELSIILLLIDVALIALIAMGAVWFFVPSFILTMVAGFTGWTSLVSLGIGASMALLLIFLALLGSFYNAFITTAWTYAFMKMHREGVTSRVLHWVGALFSR